MLFSTYATTKSTLSRQLPKMDSGAGYHISDPQVSCPEDYEEIYWSSTGSSTMMRIHQIIFILNDLYEINTSNDALIDFISAYPDMIAVFQEAHDSIIEYFSTAKLLLSVDVHSRDVRNYEASIIIKSGMPYKQAAEKMKEFDEVWGLKLFMESDGLLTITAR